MGLTSEAHRAFVQGLGVWDEVRTYGQEVPEAPSVFVDMAGNPNVTGAVHHQLGDLLQHSAIVGRTHHAASGPRGPLPGPKPTPFFAPTVAEARMNALGAETWEQRIAMAWAPFCEGSQGWLTVERNSGPEAVARVYDAMREGSVPPSAGQILSMFPAA